MREAGIEAGGVGSECGVEWKECADGSAGHFQEGEGRSALCAVSSRSDCFDQESALYGVLYQPAAGARTGAGDQDQAEGEAGGQAAGHCLDVDEEERAL